MLKVGAALNGIEEVTDLIAVAGFMWKGPTRRASPVSGEDSMMGVKSVACCTSFPGRSWCMSVRGYFHEAYTCTTQAHTIDPQGSIHLKMP